MVPIIEFVPEEDTLAVVTLKETQSASLRTTNAILIAALLIASFILNSLFIVAVLISKPLRQNLIYLMYCHLTFVNILDLSFNVLTSLLYIANGAWTMGSGWCTFNVAAQQFVQLYSLLFMMLMAAERAIGMILGSDQIVDVHGYNHRYLNGIKILVMSSVLIVVSIAFSVVVFTNAIPVKPFRNRYICGIDNGSPIGYLIARVVIYVGCLAIILLCVAAILKKRGVASLPLQSHEYSEFIKRNRAMQEHKSRAKLVILLLTVFILLEGPYISLCFVFEGYSSRELIDVDMDIPQDADTLITWLKFIFPLVCPIIMLSWCNDVWLKTKEVMCCRSYDPPTIGHYMPSYRGPGMGAVPNVMTLVATDQGVQLKMPQNTVMGHGFATSIPRRESRTECADPNSNVRQRQPSPARVPSPPTSSSSSASVEERPRRAARPPPKEQSKKSNAAPKPTGSTRRKETKAGGVRRPKNASQKAKPPPTWR